MSNKAYLSLGLVYFILSSSSSFANELQVPRIEAAAKMPKFHPLPGKTIGVLVKGIQPLLLAEGRTGSPDALGFASGDGSYRWVYIPCSPNSADAEDLTFRVGEDGKKKQLFNSVCLAKSSTIKQLAGAKTFKNYGLVEVEVNIKQGSPAVDSFVATKLQVLDGSKEFPLHVDQVVKDLDKQAKGPREEKAHDIDETLAKAQREALGESHPTGPREESQQVYVTWLPDKQLLHVVFRTYVSNGQYSYTKGANPKDPADTRGTRFGTMFGVEVTQSYDIAKDGRTKDVAPIQLNSFVKHIPPPR